jgi:hypothetical protein
MVLRRLAIMEDSPIIVQINVDAVCIDVGLMQRVKAMKNPLQRTDQEMLIRINGVTGRTMKMMLKKSFQRRMEWTGSLF